MKQKSGLNNNSRRCFIKTAGAIGAMGLIAPFSNTLWAGGTKQGNAFVIPPLAPVQRNGQQVNFNLQINQSQHQFFSGVNTPTLGINQSYLGPVLRAKRGDSVTINVRNGLNEVTTLHWHGMTLPANMDGGPHQAIQPNKTWRSRFQIRQEAGTTWYHSHAMHQTGRQVYHGLAGLFIIDDEGSDQLGLPGDYGIDDIPCTIQDRRFNRDGSLSYSSSMPDRMMGMQGSTVLVNGVVTPTLQARRTLLRLRLHNGSNARTYQLAFSDNRPFYVIASDCGFLERPLQTDSIRLAAAERIEILLDVSDKKQVTLKSVVSESNSGMPMMRMMSNQELDIMRIDARQAQASQRKVPTSLRQSSLILNPKKAVATRKFELEMGMMGRGGMGMMGGMMRRGNSGGMFRINGKSMDIKRIDFAVKRNSTEIWEISNNSPMAHPFHVHNVQFRVLDRNGRAPDAIERGLKDVVLVHAGEVVRIIMAFPEYSDPKTPYMYHCHILEHEDLGMMGQFVVA
jgi:bilirubin oxidase